MLKITTFVQAADCGGFKMEIYSRGGREAWRWAHMTVYSQTICKAFIVDGLHELRSLFGSAVASRRSPPTPQKSRSLFMLAVSIVNILTSVQFEANKNSTSFFLGGARVDFISICVLSLSTFVSLFVHALQQTPFNSPTHVCLRLFSHIARRRGFDQFLFFFEGTRNTEPKQSCGIQIKS